MARRTIEEWVAVFEAISDVGDRYHWLMGDRLIEVTAESEYGEDAIGLLSAALKKSKSTLYKHRQASLAFPTDEERTQVRLPWSYFQVVSQIRDSGKRVEWLNRANDRDMVLGQLREAVRDESQSVDFRVDRKIESWLRQLSRLEEDYGIEGADRVRQALRDALAEENTDAQAA